MPTPPVTISTPPEDLYAGVRTSLTLTCDVDIDPSLADYVNVSIMWFRETISLSDATDRVTILMESQFTSNLTLYSLSTADSTNFTCRAGIIPSDGFASATASDPGEDTVQVIVRGELF